MVEEKKRNEEKKTIKPTSYKENKTKKETNRQGKENGSKLPEGRKKKEWKERQNNTVEWKNEVIKKSEKMR